jgi:hypothetical protein
MRYMFLIYASEQAYAPGGPMASEEAQKKEFEEYFAFDAAAKEAGVLVAGDPLQPVGTATTVRVKGDKPLTTDGPFAETKEQLGGYYILDCKDLDEAMSWAARIPSARHGSVEVRPIMEIDWNR